MTEFNTSSEYEVELDTSHSENEDHSLEERLETVMREAIVRSGWEARFELRTQGLRKILKESEEEISRVERGLICVGSVSDLDDESWLGTEVVVVDDGDSLGDWMRGEVVGVTMAEDDGTVMYSVQLRMGEMVMRPGYKVARFRGCPSCTVTIGSRVVVVVAWSRFQAGVVGESPIKANGGKYLVFLDNDTALYVSPENVREVICSSHGLEGVPEESRAFLTDYLALYPERRMVNLETNQSVMVKRSGKWWSSKVVSLEASLAKITFEDGLCEWIYRGSNRLWPLRNSRKAETLNRPSITSKKREDGVLDTMNTMNLSSSHSCDDTRGCSVSDNLSPTYPDLVLSHTQECVGYVSIDYTPPILISHSPCVPSCISLPPPPNLPLLLTPLHCGWARQVRHKRHLSIVLYIAPCGVKLRSMAEVQTYLHCTGHHLGIDSFTFCPELEVSTQWRVPRNIIVIDDISNGQEAVPVPVINNVDEARPELEYCTVRDPQSGVVINTETDFLVCCDCVDDCVSITDCQCRQLTVQSTLGDVEGEVWETAGYQYRRLHHQVVTGIYECNSRCSCSMLCHNRVVQQPCIPHLQIFRSSLKGWGVRTTTELPKGAFICIYVGRMYTPEEGNDLGRVLGDEFFAALDFIDVIEERKEGYESDVSILSESEISETSRSSSNCWTEEESEDTPNMKRDTNTVPLSIRKLGSKLVKLGSVTPRKKLKLSDTEEETKVISTRELFGDVREEPYILDARVKGNLGKYLNHSCDPNIFAQNVFVDTHDLRFPWIAFFTSRRLEAGEELAWDYNYQVGAVEGKRIDCHCGSDICRKRLL